MLLLARTATVFGSYFQVINNFIDSFIIIFNDWFLHVDFSYIRSPALGSRLITPFQLRMFAKIFLNFFSKKEQQLMLKPSSTKKTKKQQQTHKLNPLTIAGALKCPWLTKIIKNQLLEIAFQFFFPFIPRTLL